MVVAYHQSYSVLTELTMGTVQIAMMGMCMGGELRSRKAVIPTYHPIRE